MTDDVLVHGDVADISVVASQGTVVLISRYAQSWYTDAREVLSDAQAGDSSANRRQVLFAACCAESYLYEWTFDCIRRNASALEAYDQIEKYLSGGDKSSFLDRWKKVPKLLFQNDLVSGVPDHSGKDWPDFCKLFSLRHGIVHAHLSHPRVHGGDSERAPGVTPEEIEALPAGWAYRVVALQIRKLNEAAGFPVPAWLESTGDNP